MPGIPVLDVLLQKCPMPPGVRQNLRLIALPGTKHLAFHANAFMPAANAVAEMTMALRDAARIIRRFSRGFQGLKGISMVGAKDAAASEYEGAAFTGVLVEIFPGSFQLSLPIATARQFT